MWQVDVVNKITGLKYSLRFETRAQANTWKDEQVSKQSWGRNARLAIRGQDKFDESLVLSEQDITVNGTIFKQVSLAAEYEYEVYEVDLSANTSQARKERLALAEKESQEFKKFRDFGVTVELYFTKLVNDRAVTQTQKDQLQTSPAVAAIISQLRFGRIAQVRRMTDAVKADGVLFFQEDIDKVKLLMDDFLAEL